jgi:hypothetical protein
MQGRLVFSLVAADSCAHPPPAAGYSSSLLEGTWYEVRTANSRQLCPPFSNYRDMYSSSLLEGPWYEARDS